MPARVEKAELRELDSDFRDEINPDKTVVVQFNPESLKVSFANQIKTPEGAGDQNGGASRQFVGAGTTKLAVQLWFDVASDEDAEHDDVRELTQKVAYFITPQDAPRDRNKKVPPALRFLWGSFQFDGLVESMEETLELFSAEGRPLRASVSLNVTSQKIQFAFGSEAAAIPPAGSDGPGGAGSSGNAGQRPLTPAPEGASVQQLAQSQGRQGDWQRIARGNDVENPRQLPVGSLLDMNPFGGR
jgi:hypothetical protein